ncbi:MAG: RNA polymerase sigma factor, partial [Bacteroidales bacterium]
TALGYLRKQKNFRVTDLSDSALHLPDNSVSVLDALSAGEILRCVDKLPEGYRLVLNLYAVEGYSHREIATMLGISEGTSRSQYSRARSALQKMVIDMQTSNAV